MKSINVSLISLKCVLFLVFGAIGSLFPFLPLHMNDIGLSKDESILVSIISPLIALLGPLVAAPLADRLAGGFGGASRSKTGGYLRVMISACLVLATVFYWLLIVVPPVIRSPPNVSFVCDERGGFILQDRCGKERTCFNWGSSKGSVQVKNCIFSCNATSSYAGEMTTIPPYEESHESINESDYYDSGDGPLIEPELPPAPTNETGAFVPHPHMCYRNVTGDMVCEVYTEYSQPINFKISLNRDPSSNNNTEETCKYSFVDEFQCRLNPEVVKNLTNDGQDECQPVILCEIHRPYTNKDSLLRKSRCGYDNISFWLYLFIRSVADIFPAAAVVLLATAVVIATRETSTGRGDMGKQFAAAALGFAIFPPLIGGCADGRFADAMVCFTLLMAVAVVILLLDGRMPLSPPEWWWHTRCGLLALPMSSVRNYVFETAALGVVLLVLGVFWNAIDSFLPWHVVKIAGGTPLVIGLTVTMGALPAVLYLIFAERIVDYCGHNNILIFCFVNYICHHLALMYIDVAAYLFLCEYLEAFTLHVMYITAALYLRHLVPRKFTACGQALPIVAHFCLGRCIGSALGGLAYSSEYDADRSFQEVHRAFAIAAAAAATLYFLVYHFYLKPKCVPPMHLPPDPAPAVVQGMNGNGSYTPLRVYHNSKSKKGHFRY